MQLRELRGYAERRGLTIVGEYIDRMTGSKDSRPDLNRLMAHAGQRKFDAVLVWKLDRFGRSLRHLVNALAELEALGLTFISLRDNLDLSTPSGRLMFQIIGAMAEFERSLIQERVKAGLRNAKAKGVRLGRPRVFVSESRIDALRASGASWRSRKNWVLPSARFTASRKGVPKSATWILEQASRRTTMPSNPAKPFLVPRRADPQLQRVNESIARLAAVRPAADVFRAFALAAHLADLAIEAALELAEMPGIDTKALEPTINFWKVVRNQSQAAALASVGANHTLAGALVAFRLLRNIEEEEI